MLLWRIGTPTAYRQPEAGHPRRISPLPHQGIHRREQHHAAGTVSLGRPGDQGVEWRGGTLIFVPFGAVSRPKGALAAYETKRPLPYPRC